MKKPKLQNAIDEHIKLGNSFRAKLYPEKLYAIVKKNGHFECSLHIRKTIDGIAALIRRKQGYIDNSEFFVYELPFKREFIVYDSEISKKKKL